MCALSAPCVMMQGPKARAEVADLVSGLQAAAELLPVPEDRLIAFVEAAEALGAVGSARKRVLLMWQAVELSKLLGFPTSTSYELARRALEPASEDWAVGGEAGAAAAKGPLGRAAAVPRCWGLVRAGCLEGGSRDSNFRVFFAGVGFLWCHRVASCRDCCRKTRFLVFSAPPFYDDDPIKPKLP